MKSLALAIAASVLVGCSVDNSNNCSSLHGYTNEQTDVNGLTLQPSQDMHATFEQVSTYYAATMACMGMTATGPDVVYRNFRTYYNKEVFGPWALYHPGGLVQMNTDEEPSQGFTRDCRTDKEALKHEFVHHILNANGLDWHHGDPMFAKCGVGVNTYN